MPSDEYIDKIVNNINDGKYNKKELENLYANAERKGVEKVKKAIDRQARKAVSSEPDLKEIDFKTMKSKLLPNFFIAGEVLNIDAVTGGFNFQACWSEAWLISQALNENLF